MTTRPATSGALLLFLGTCFAAASTVPFGGCGGGGSPNPTMTGAQPGEPVIFFTDLGSAPPGAYVTLWGKNFGSSQGDSTVTIGDTEVQRFISWSDGRIELQLPGLARSGDLVVHTTGGDSPPYPFGVHAGMLVFVSRDGDDSWSGTVEIPIEGNGPLRSILRARDILQPGDILYIREGTFIVEDEYSSILSLRDLPSGTADRPIAIVGYPGETATLGDNTIPRILSLYRGEGTAPLDYLTIAKLHLRPLCTAAIIESSGSGRFIGNEITGATAACMSGALTISGSSGWKILGNTITGNGNTRLEHAVYLSGYGTISGLEIAWNTISQQAGGSGIQLYGHEEGDRIENILIHDNVIMEIDRDGILLGESDADVLRIGNVIIFNNIIQRCGRCAGWGITIGNSTAAEVGVLHNTFAGNGQGDTPCDGSTGEAMGQMSIQKVSSIKLHNNIFSAPSGTRYVDAQVTAARLEASSNLFSGAGAPPEWDSDAVSGDPLFVDAAAADYHLMAGSPAIDGAPWVEITYDHDGLARPQGPTADIGAYEFPVTAGP